MHPINQLTVREAEVLRLLASGHTYGRVAELLGISRNTIASHVKNIYRKLGVHSGRGAVRRAFALCLLVDGESAYARLSGLETEQGEAICLGKIPTLEQ